MITATYKSKINSEILKFDVMPSHDLGAFFLQVDGSVLSLLLPKLNGTEIALKFIVDGLGFEGRIEFLKTAISLLHPSDFEKLRSGFRTAFANEFSNSTWKEVTKFCEELNEIISARMASEFSFEDFDLDEDHLAQIFSSSQQVIP